jgi:hypothetical protein
MIHIIKGQVNEVALTLSEKSQLSAPVFLFRFIHSTTGDEKAFLCQDQSSFYYRYSLFLIEETETEDLLNGKVELQDGDWTYEVYEQEDPTNLDYEEAYKLLEVGRVKVKGAATTNSTYNGNQQGYIYR